MKKVFKRIYKSIPLKKETFSFLKKFITPSESLYKHLYFQGDIQISVDDLHSFKIRHYGYEVENSLFWAGLTNGWEKLSLSIWIKLAAQSNVIFDIGANTGVYSMIAKSLNPQAQVYAFEPVKRVFEKLEYNNRLNSFDISCFEYAASNENGSATIYDTPTDHTYSVTVGKNLNAANIPVIPTEIETIRLDSIIEKFDLPRIDLMKIDVETHEAEVIEGLGKYLEEFKPIMLVEILSDTVGEKVETLVSGKGYLYFNLDEKLETIKRVEHLTKSDHYNYLLCSEETAKMIIK